MPPATRQVSYRQYPRDALEPQMQAPGQQWASQLDLADIAGHGGGGYPDMR